MEIDAVERLRLFSQQARKLEKTRFLADIRNSPNTIQFRFSYDTGFSWVVDGEEPYWEYVNSFILLFRLFINKLDGISLLCLAKYVLPDPAISQEWKDEFRTIRRKFNDYKDSPLTGNFAVVFEGDTLTNWNIVDGFLNGELAHITQYKTVEKWRIKMQMDEYFRFQFYAVLVKLADFVARIADITDKELDRIHQQNETATLD